MKPSPFSVAARLPKVYLKFREQLGAKPSPVHYIADERRWKYCPIRNKIVRIENVPIPLTFPKEADVGLWGGEAVIRGFQKDKPKRRRFPNFWIPNLIRTVVYSDILNKYMVVTVTARTLQLIDQHYGFDNYILETPVQDLKSQLALDIRRHMYLTLADQTSYYDDPEEQKRVFEKYSKFAIPKEEAEWFGLTMRDAVKKQKLIEYSIKPIPLKHLYRKQLIERLKAEKIEKTEATDSAGEPAADKSISKSKHEAIMEMNSEFYEHRLKKLRPKV